jgi:formylglycine-generating enzyme required for sulfatase activity
VLAAADDERPTERASPPPQCNANAVVWRTPKPPEDPQKGDIWINPKDGMQMVYVAAGEFILGTSEAEHDTWVREHPGVNYGYVFHDEQPQCRVRLPGYWIGRTQVTNAQYLRFAQATGHGLPHQFEQFAGDKVPAGRDDFPVVGVTWDDARAYCVWSGCRLPTELEWEKAARGTDGRTFPWGFKWDSGRCRNVESLTGKTYLNYEELVTAVKTWNRTHNMVWDAATAVGSFPAGASPYGCLDMIGNAGQWCADWYEGEAYRRYASGDLTAPTRGQYSWRVVRGDTFYMLPLNFRCASRAPDLPEGGPLSAAHSIRCARDAAR